MLLLKNALGLLIDFLRNRRLLLFGGVKNLFKVLMYVYVHCGLSQIFSWPESKILGYARSLMLMFRARILNIFILTY